jgi:hypothetical protein
LVIVEIAVELNRNEAVDDCRVLDSATLKREIIRVPGVVMFGAAAEKGSECGDEGG